MPRYIDADVLIPDLYSRRREIPHQIDGNTDWYLQGFNVGIVHAVIAVENAPTISPDEARGVVHCGECIYSAVRESEILCPAVCVELKPYDYCSHGVKWEVSEDA